MLTVKSDGWYEDCLHEIDEVKCSKAKINRMNKSSDVTKLEHDLTCSIARVSPEVDGNGTASQKVTFLTKRTKCRIIGNHTHHHDAYIEKKKPSKRRALKLGVEVTVVIFIRLDSCKNVWQFKPEAVEAWIENELDRARKSKKLRVEELATFVSPTITVQRKRTPVVAPAPPLPP